VTNQGNNKNMKSLIKLNYDHNGDKTQLVL